MKNSLTFLNLRTTSSHLAVMVALVILPLQFSPAQSQSVGISDIGSLQANNISGGPMTTVIINIPPVDIFKDQGLRDSGQIEPIEPATLGQGEFLPDVARNLQLTCDEAAHPEDPDRPAGLDGTPWHALKPTGPILACRLLMKHDSALPRFGANLARAYMKAEQYTDAIEAAEQVAHRGSVSALNTLGSMERDGLGTPQDYSKAIFWFETAAESGYVVSMLNLGDMYAEGQGVEKNDDEAVKWYKGASDKGYAEATTSYAWMMRMGRGLEKDPRQAMQLFEEAAAKNDARAMWNIGLMYANGEGVEKDTAEAAKWYRQAAELGSAGAMNSLAWTYESGLGNPKDDTLAFEWYEKAALAGNSDGMANLGLLYLYGEGVVQDHAQALEWIQKAADLQNARGVHTLGWMYANGRALAIDYNKAQELYEKAIKLGNIRAKVSLGVMFAKGWGLTRNFDRAFVLYQEAAQKGDANGMANLGFLYLSGSGVPKNEEEAAEWFRKSAEGGHTEGMVEFGRMLRMGHGVEQDYKEAERWFLEAIENGDSDGMVHIGLMHEYGDGFEQSYEEAAAWYRKAAEAGNPGGMTNLAWMHRTGNGVERDYAKARDLLDKAVVQNFARAMYNIARMYERGEGVTRSNDEALLWYQKAAEAGHLESMNTLAWGFLWGSLDVEPDEAKGLEWLLKAAEEGHVKSMRNLADFYTGIMSESGTPPDIEEAFVWYLKAAEAGDISSMTRAGTMLLLGLPGIPVDTPNGIEWLTKAADQGDRIAALVLGTIYHYGEGVEPDYERARFWYEKLLLLAETAEEEWNIKEAGELLENLEQTVALGRPVSESPFKRDQFQIAPTAVYTDSTATLGGAVAEGMIGNQFGEGRGRTVATIAGTLVGGVLGDQVSQYLSQQDQVYAQQTAMQSLEARQPSTWTNPDTGARGTFTPAPQYFHDEYGRLCTNYQHQIYTAQGQPFTDSGTMCKQDNGDWRTVGVSGQEGSTGSPVHIHASANQPAPERDRQTGPGSFARSNSGVFNLDVSQALSPQDQTYAERAIIQSLTARQPVPWENPQSRARGDFIPLTQLPADEQGRLCITYQHQVSATDGRIINDNGTMCKHPNGNWFLKIH